MQQSDNVLHNKSMMFMMAKLDKSSVLTSPILVKDSQTNYADTEALTHS